MDNQAGETTHLLNKEINLKTKLNALSFLFSVRFLLTFLLFLCSAFLTMQKIDMSISIVCMINSSSTDLPNTNQANESDEDICLFSLNESQSINRGEFDWSKKSQSFVLSSYFYGFILTQIPSGWLSLKFGGKRVLGFAMFIGSVLTVLVPVVSRYNFTLLLICRFITGLSHGMVWPAANDIFIRWIPPAEKSRLIGFATAGSKIGNIIALPFGTYLCVNGFDNGWPSIFYIFGLIGILWCVLFMLLTTNSPANHKFISRTESDYLINTTYNSSNQNHQINTSTKKRKKTPWLKILTSKACIAIYFVHFSSNWGNYLFLTQLPTFMNEILKFDIQSNGMFSALPYVTGWVCAIVSSQISDILIHSELMSRNSVRKMFSSLAMIIPMIATLGLAFVDCSNPYLAVVLLAIGVGFLGLSTGAGLFININEIGGIYSGVLFGVSNTFATIPGIVAPYVVSVLTTHKLQSEWRIVFILTSVIYLIGGIVFALLSEAETQSWAVDKTEEDSQS